METIIYLLTGLIAIAIVAGLIAYCVNRHYTAKECIECVEAPDNTVMYDRMVHIRKAYEELPYIKCETINQDKDLREFLVIIDSNTRDILTR